MVLGGGAFGRQLGPEGGAFTNRISAYIKDPQRALLSFPPLCEKTVRRLPPVIRKRVLTRL